MEQKGQDSVLYKTKQSQGGVCTYGCGRERGRACYPVGKDKDGQNSLLSRTEGVGLIMQRDR